MKHYSTKKFIGFPCAHRQWRHDGHCKYIHGYSRDFYFVFEADYLDDKGFVKDFSDFTDLKQWLTDKFDHTLLINPDDPLMSKFLELESLGACKLVVPPYGVSMEGVAKWIYELWAPKLEEIRDGEHYISLVKVEVHENEKNSGGYTVYPPSEEIWRTLD